MRVLFLTKYGSTGASSRYRFLQYIPYLESKEILCTVSPLFDDRYLDRRFGGQRKSTALVVGAFIRRLRAMRESRKFDLLVIEKELLPFVPSPFERWFGSEVPFIIDYDDAQFHHYDQHPSWMVRRLLGEKIHRIMGNATAVVVGNDYLAAYARTANECVKILPTVIDLSRYDVPQEPPPYPFKIGWIGTPLTAQYLENIAAPLRAFCASHPATIVAIGSGPIDLGTPVEMHPWAYENEVSQMARFHVGIMPVPDRHFERGKCGLKLIQYMGCRKPVIAAPVGVNVDLVGDRERGFLARHQSEWYDALKTLFDAPETARTMGRAGRVLVEQKYSLDQAQVRMAEIISECVGRER